MATASSSWQTAGLLKPPKQRPAKSEELHVEGFWQDIRYAIRTLVKSPGFTAVAVLTLALGIGANTAIFSVIDAALLRSLPYGEPARIMAVYEKRPAEHTYDNVVSPADYLDWSSRNTVFEAMAAEEVQPLDLLGAGEPQRVLAGTVTARFFDVLDVRASLGRVFQPGDDQSGRDNVVILSHGLWKRFFAADPEIIGKTVRINGVSHSIIGVLPPNFQFASEKVQLWVPYTFPPAFREIRGAHFLNVFARLRPGVTRKAAQAEMDTISAELKREHPKENHGHSSNVVSLRETLVGGVRSSLLILGAAVGLVLLIACANVANLLLVRSTGRNREFSIRRAVGASPSRLVRQLLTENLLLSLLGGMVGLLLAGWGIAALPLIIPAGSDLPALGQLRLDVRVLAYLFVTCLLTTVLCSLAPAFHSSRTDLASSLRSGIGVTSLAHSARRLRLALTVAELALSLVLLCGAGLMIRTLVHLLDQNPGFSPDHLFTFAVVLPANRFPQPTQRAAFLDAVAARLRALPEVESVGGITDLPLSGEDSRSGIAIESMNPDPSEHVRAHSRVVLPGYFETMRIPLIAGRMLRSTDTAEAPPVIVLNQAAIRRYVPNRNPLGLHLRIGGHEEWREIVGVVGDTRHWGLDQPVNPEMYVPEAQSPESYMNVVIRSTSDTAALAPAVRSVVRDLDPTMPLGEFDAMETVIEQSVAPRSFYMWLLTIFAGLALLLAGVGVYGVMAQLVEQRTNEIGIRMALGAHPRDMLRLFLAQGLRLTALGVALGLAAALALSRFLASLLYGVTATDPLTYLGVAILLSGVALLACYIPARRAMQVDPMIALRYE
jgi:putative ABC transport system permease protein